MRVQAETRLAAAERGLLEADSALRRAAEGADEAERELQQSDEAARTFLAEESAGRDQAAAVAMQKALFNSTQKPILSSVLLWLLKNYAKSTKNKLFKIFAEKVVSAPKNETLGIV